MGRLAALAVVGMGVGIGIACLRRHHSTRDPPHEQLLMRLGAGGVSSLFVRCPLLVVVRPSFVTRHPFVSPYLSALRAVARSSKGRDCGWPSHVGSLH
jgi:hypothetical protein